MLAAALLVGAAGRGAFAAPLENDMVPVEMTESAATAADAGTTSTGSTGTKAPAVIYLAYADGTALPATSPNACVGVAPKFKCTFASSLKECQRQIQAYLDKWYADFNVVFTLTRPTSGAFYTEVVSSGGGGWCNASATTAGIAPFYCKDLGGGVAYTFMGGQAAKETAIIVAQEQAHLVGLEHTKSTQDVMDPTICPNCDGFQNVVNQVDGDRCGRATQNSYQMMLDGLGPWPGGVKPTPFGCDPDTVAPSVSIVSPANQARVTSSFQLTTRATDDCAVKTVSVKVSPMGLQTSSSSPPFSWTLTRITGKQTITVTATDTSGKSSSASVIVNAPGSDAGVADAGGASDGKAADAMTTVAGDAAGPDGGTAEVNGGQASGCAVGGGPGTGFVASAAFALALLVAWAHRRRSVAQPIRSRSTDRRRRV